MRCRHQGAHIRERLTANRSDLTLQGRPNQHGTYLPRRTIRAKHSPPCLELQDHPTIIWSAELNERPPKVKHASHFSATTRPPQEVSWSPVLSKQRSTRLTGFDYLLLPAFSLYNSNMISRADNGTVLNRHRRSYTFLRPVSKFYFSFPSKISNLYMETKCNLHLASNWKLLDFYWTLSSITHLSSDLY